MGWILFIVGFVIGLFLWASILGTLLIHTPMVLRFKSKKIIDRINISKIIVPLLIAGTVLIIGYTLSLNFAWGASFGGLAMLFNLNNLRKENWVNVTRDYNIGYIRYHSRESMLRNGFSESDERLREAVEEQRTAKEAVQKR